MRTLRPRVQYAPRRGARSHHAVVADHRGTDQLDAGVDLRALAHPDAGPQREALDVDLDLAVQDVLVGAEVGLEGADVLPVAVGHVAVEPLAGGQGGRERLAREVDGLPLGDEVEDLRLEDVDAGVDGVAEHLAPGRLLQEPLDRPVLVGDDDAELERVLDRLEGQGGQAPVGVVEVDDGAEVDVGQDVAGDDEEPLVELVLGVAHRTGRAERGRLGGVDHAHAELGPVAEVGADGVGHEGHGDHDVLEAVGPQQVDDVLHHRDVGHGEHRLGLVGGERPQPRPLAAGHDHCLHRFTPSFVDLRSSRVPVPPVIPRSWHGVAVRPAASARAGHRARTRRRPPRPGPDRAADDPGRHPEHLLPTGRCRQLTRNSG